jgi:hypothetical protein
MPIPGLKLGVPLDEAGPMRLKCDAGHTWMSAWVVVKPHRFAAVTRPDGTFRLEGVPPGRYTVELWHEKLGKKTLPVTVVAGAEARVDAAW